MKAGLSVINGRAAIMTLAALTVLTLHTAFGQDVSEVTIDYVGGPFLYASLDKPAIIEGRTHIAVTVYTDQPDEISSIEVGYCDNDCNEFATCRNEYRPLSRDGGMVSVDVVPLHVEIDNTPKDITVVVSINGGRPIHHESARFHKTEEVILFGQYVTDVDSIFSNFFSHHNTLNVVEGEMDLSVDIYVRDPRRFKEAAFIFLDSVTHEIISDYNIDADEMIYNEERVTVKMPSAAITVGATPRVLLVCIVLNKMHMIYGSYIKFRNREINLNFDRASSRDS